MDALIGGCGVNTGDGFCVCDGYTEDPNAMDPFGEPKEDFCDCNHHKNMHFTVEPEEA